MKSIGIFCGSSEGHSSVYMQAAREAGTYLAQAGLGIVYGGRIDGGRGGFSPATRRARDGSDARVFG